LLVDDGVVDLDVVVLVDDGGGGLFLFDAKKDPALVDMPNIDTQLHLYFSY